jgi:hypothetical protein
MPTPKKEKKIKKELSHLLALKKLVSVIQSFLKSINIRKLINLDHMSANFSFS